MTHILTIELKESLDYHDPHNDRRKIPKVNIDAGPIFAQIFEEYRVFKKGFCSNVTPFNNLITIKRNF